jgi:hypothetical protein
MEAFTYALSLTERECSISGHAIPKQINATVTSHVKSHPATRKNFRMSIAARSLAARSAIQQSRIAREVWAQQVRPPAVGLPNPGSVRPMAHHSCQPSASRADCAAAAPWASEKCARQAHRRILRHVPTISKSARGKRRRAHSAACGSTPVAIGWAIPLPIMSGILSDG